MPPVSMDWTKSRILVGVLVSAVFKVIFAVLTLFNVDVPFTPAEAQPLIEALTLLISLVGDGVAGQARVVQKHAPSLTIGKKQP